MAFKSTGNSTTRSNFARQSMTFAQPGREPITSFPQLTNRVLIHNIFILQDFNFALLSFSSMYVRKAWCNISAEMTVTERSNYPQLQVGFQRTNKQSALSNVLTIAIDFVLYEILIPIYLHEYSK
ncbi:hypothetical protein EGR_10228 [Echinococcus granulosus]|uniref:Uncharacterized protein n=1 Tax=Echinococcus granulosus TaxID=6210 RepID=W6U1I8_ECHGR|nr:hypothetical protein EGR_10228 [Echinococcus granulosus]EUB54918.1 hypothetical protein EGR_10228 [Echinococcus granulosus]